MGSLPEDIQPEWLSVIRRLQSISKSGGLSVLTISILVDQDGRPLSWIEPDQKKIEPKSMASALIMMANTGQR